MCDAKKYVSKNILILGGGDTGGLIGHIILRKKSNVNFSS